MTSMSEAVPVPEKAKQTESAPSQWAWVDRAIWTERMLAALGNGVKGHNGQCWQKKNAYFANLGLFTMTQARQASQPR